MFTKIIKLRNGSFIVYPGPASYPESGFNVTADYPTAERYGKEYTFAEVEKRANENPSILETEPAPTILDPEELAAVTKRGLTDAVQTYMDAKAQEKGYDDLKSAVTYASFPAVKKFQDEGIAFGNWRSLVWASCYEQLAEAKATGVIPTIEEVLAKLPALVLPE